MTQPKADLEEVTPEAMEPLFRGCDLDPFSNACMRWPGQQPWDAYAEGFLMAAQRTLSECIESSAWQDILVYPIVFLYRHYIELRLKQILGAAGDLLDRDVHVSMNHDIVRLWTRCRPLLEEVWPGSGDSELDVAQDIITELAAVDKGSHAFRYPIDTRGQPSLPAEIRHINLRHFGERMNQLESLLEGVVCGIEQYQQHKYEAEHFARTIR